MLLPNPLLSGRLLRRYQRFFADVELDDGEVVTAHTPNTGSMRQCAVPGLRVLVSRSADPKRKLRFTLELIEVNGHWVDTHTQRTNRLAEEGMRQGWIAELAGYEVRREVPFGASRIDFALSRGAEQVLVEVKNVTLVKGAAVACFPDAVTLRGQKHLGELCAAVAQGWRAVILFLVQRGEAVAFGPADHIDPDYGRLLREAAHAGVEVLAYRTRATPESNRVEVRLPVLL